MKAVIVIEGKSVASHFGRAAKFTILESGGDKLIKKEIVDNPGHKPGFLPAFFNEKGIDTVICGGMGMRAQMLFDEFGIKVITGIAGSIEEVTKKIIEGNLQSEENRCSPGAAKNTGVKKEGYETQ
jgi:predicted Fe-Mo cluster-binding NifX family protein